MKHIVVFIVIASSIYFLAIRKSDLDKLMIPATGYSETQVGNRFVDIEPSRLPITPYELVEPGVTTVVYFHDAQCHGCRQLDRNLTDFLRVRPDVAVRKVSISPGKDGYSEAIRNFRSRIYMTPFILIFSSNGKLIAGDDRTDGKGYDLLEKWMVAELKRAAN